jgi:hypothetical protein
MELEEGFEPPTGCLQNSCSTPELLQQQCIRLRKLGNSLSKRNQRENEGVFYIKLKKKPSKALDLFFTQLIGQSLQVVCRKITLIMMANIGRR